MKALKIISVKNVGNHSSVSVFNVFFINSIWYKLGGFWFFRDYFSANKIKFRIQILGGKSMSVINPNPQEFLDFFYSNAF